ncbi:tetratricopeptide repeat protein [Candidatus Poribacteria bacterium]|nr:tetratricopeptide repeat protein [Candidatus Poribacteria bacterium]MYH79838.1 tetratricopeptide repeat protein [Candidatus Poribacteria bacterium]MYK94009.1 tetratricopeptide repeat protein [Candidatus Poribacteria bacterium]
MKQHNKCLLVLLALGILFSCARTPRQLVFQHPVVPIESVNDSIVWIESGTGSGTGFFVAPDKIVTNIHLVAPPGSIIAKSPDKETIWKIEGVVGFDAKNSLVLLKVAGEGMPLLLADSDAVQSSEAVSIVGYPNGTYKVTKANILYRIRNSNEWLPMKATTAQESSGGPVLNSEKRVIGVTLRYGNDSYGYAIPSNMLKGLLARSMPVEPLEAWQQRKPVRAEAHYSFGERKFAVKDYAGALVDFDKAIELNPAYFRAYYECGKVQSHLGDIESARGDVEEAQPLYHQGITNFDRYLQLKNNPEVANGQTADSKVAKVGESIVLVMGWTGTLNSFFGGSGFFVDEDKIATNIHNVALPGPVFAKLSGKKTICTIEGVTAYDVKNDLVVLKIAGEGMPLPLADGDKVQSGERVTAMGYPNIKYKVTQGTIQSIWNTWLRIRMKVGFLSGNSGGPVLNKSGQIIGVYAAGSGRYGYAIRSNVLKMLLAEAKPTEPLAAWRKRDPIRAYAYHVQGKVKYEAGHYQEAIADFDKAVQLNPETHFYTYYKRGEAKATLGEHESAIADFDKAIQLNPEFAAEASYARKRAVKALKEKETAKKARNPRNLPDYIARAKQRFSLGEFQAARGNAEKAQELLAAAIEDWTHVIKLAPGDAEAYSGRGLAKLVLGDVEGAITDFDKAIEINPESAEAYYNRGRAKEALGQKEAAQADFQKAQELNSDVEK